MNGSSEDLLFHEVLIEACQEIERGEAPCLEFLVDAKGALQGFALLVARNPRLEDADRQRCIVAIQNAAGKLGNLEVVRKIIREG